MTTDRPITTAEVLDTDEDGMTTVKVTRDGQDEYHAIRSDMAVQWAAQEVACADMPAYGSADWDESYAMDEDELARAGW